MSHFTRKSKLVVIGCGYHGMVCGEIAELVGYHSIVFINIGNCPPSDFPWKIISSISGGLDLGFVKSMLLEYDFFVAVGDNGVRRNILNQLMILSADVAVLIHPSAIVSGRAKIGRGVAICSGAIVQMFSIVGDGVIVNSGAIVEHHCVLNAFSHLSPGVRLSGNVVIGEGVWLGTGTCVRDKISIEPYIVVGVGGVVVKNLVCRGVYVGVPAKLTLLGNNK